MITTDKYYSWDFDENLIYIFELKKPKIIDEDTFVITSFNKKYKLSQKFHSTLSNLFDDIEKQIDKSSSLKVIFYQFKNKPLDCGIFSEFIHKKF